MEDDDFNDTLPSAAYAFPDFLQPGSATPQQPAPVVPVPAAAPFPPPPPFTPAPAAPSAPPPPSSPGTFAVPFQLPFNVFDVAVKWCVFDLLDPMGLSVFADAVQLSAFFKFEGGKQHSEFLEIAVLGKGAQLRLIGIYDNATEANQALREYRAVYKPRNNKPKGSEAFDAQRKKIMCVETGMKFNSLTDAARAMDVHLSSMSSHISGRTGYKTIKGYTFVKI